VKIIAGEKKTFNPEKKTFSPEKELFFILMEIMV